MSDQSPASLLRKTFWSVRSSLQEAKIARVEFGILSKLTPLFLAFACWYSSINTLFTVSSSGREVACFNNHSRPIEHYFQVPEDVNTRMKRTVISVAEDHSVAIISIEEMSW